MFQEHTVQKPNGLQHESTCALNKQYGHVFYCHWAFSCLGPTDWSWLMLSF